MAFKRIVILTGAGISAESGLATFRDSNGLWEQHDPMDIATPEAFARDPSLVYRFYNARRLQLQEVEPNKGHQAVAQLQRQFTGDVFLITQNVDDLHQRGGSEQVCQMHGSLASMRCTYCGNAMEAMRSFDADSSCRLCGQSGCLRPDIVWFGEMPQHMETIDQALGSCDLFIAVGTSGSVYPAAGFVAHARASGAVTVEVNPRASDTASHFHHLIEGPATVELPLLVAAILEDRFPLED